ncbi:hypothetical protein ACFV16_30760 [Streptomyces massasporeus]|uniref:hypothetical protein n=1 Tax=Streptomyces massasporeus TaxID=67324 RepID=UPI0036BB023A
MTPSPPGRTAQLTAVLTAALLALTPRAHTTAHASPGDPSAPPTRPSAAAARVDPHDPQLQLPAHHPLAQPKILDLDQQQRSLTQVITTSTAGTAGPAPTPRPFPTQQPNHGQRPTPGHTGHSSATPGASSTASAPASAQPPANAMPTGSARPAPAADQPHRPALRTALGLLALLTALITATLTIRTRRPRHRTTRTGTGTGTGTTTPTAAPTPAAAPGAQSPAMPEGAARLDTALRTLAHHTQKRGQELPQLRAARITTDTVAVLPDDQTLNPPQPFTRAGDGWWHLPGDVGLLNDDTARTVPAPYPALATLGTTTSTGQSALTLLNLAHPSAVLLEGSPTHIEEVLTALALELLTSPWSAGTDIITTGFGQELQHLTACPRATHLPRADEAVHEMSERLLEAAQLPHPHQRPHLLLTTQPISDELAATVADLTDKAAPVPLILIAPAHTTARHFPHALTLDASCSTPQHLALFQTTITLQRLTHDAYQHAVAALTTPQALTTGEGADQPRPHQAPDSPDRDSHEAAPPLPHQHTTDTNSPDDAPAPTKAADPAHTPAPAPTDPTPEKSNEAFPALRAATSPTSTQAPVTSDPGTPHHQADAGFSAFETGGQRGRVTEPTPHKDSTAGANTTGGRHHARSRHAHPAEEHPEIRVLGPLEVTGVRPRGHGPRIAQLASLLYFKPGRTTDELCTHMDPTNPWTASTLNARLYGLRRALGNDPNGQPYVPRRHTADTPYHLAPTVCCDWTHFLNLTPHPPHHPPAELKDPQHPQELQEPHELEHLKDLERALMLVRGKPFGGKPLPWAEPLAQEMTTRIIDVAHSIATHRTAQGPHHHLAKARQAIATALDIDDTAEVLYRDWLRLEAAAGNRSGLHTVISRLQHLTHTLGAPLQPETEQLINQLLHTTPQRHTP